MNMPIYCRSLELQYLIMPAPDSPTTTDMDMAPDPSKGRPKSDLFEGFNNLNLLRQAGLMIGLAASVAIGFAVVLWTQGEDYRPLYASLDRVDSSEVFEILEQSRIDYKIDVAP